ncbi:GLUG motif-containing protein [Epilithonimonas sp.]|uniref:GLUG motif-containing protein n=1 Tax=Epilithonimonas sp. TaxID=2894511 RepID=UPI002899E9F7|nr:GLUG motif-containing protein [Epilithonimonas sp.]
MGGIVGLNYAYTKDCSVTKAYVGGIAGIQYYSIFTSFYYCQITGTSAIGGIVGIKYYGEITNSYSSSDLFGNSQIGGLVRDSNSAVIKNSYARGKITGNLSLKGLLSGIYLHPQLLQIVFGTKIFLVLILQ